MTHEVAYILSDASRLGMGCVLSQEVDVSEPRNVKKTFNLISAGGSILTLPRKKTLAIIKMEALGFYF